jgi:hypothetical protein
MGVPMKVPPRYRAISERYRGLHLALTPLQALALMDEIDEAAAPDDVLVLRFRVAVANVSLWGSQILMAPAGHDPDPEVDFAVDVFGVWPLEQAIEEGVA